MKHHPEMRNDQGLMVAYTFIIDFMEAVSTEASKLSRRNQELLKDILLVAKLSEVQLQKYIEANVKEVRQRP